MPERVLRAAASRAALLAAAAAAALLCAVPPPARAASTDPYQAVSLALGQGLVAFFPAVEGFVRTAAAPDEPR